MILSIAGCLKSIMQVLAIILPYCRTTSNFALSCRAIHNWSLNNGFPIRTSEGQLSRGNFSFYKSLGCPGIDEWMRKKIFKTIRDDKPESLQLLFQYMVNIEAKDGFGSTALIKATIHDRTDCLSLLLQGGANIEATNDHGATALIKAASYNSTGCMRLLLECKADIKATDDTGNTALMWAFERIDSLRILLEKGADIEAKNDNGWTALVCAAEHGQTDCLRVLLQSGAKVSPVVREKYPQYAELW